MQSLIYQASEDIDTIKEEKDYSDPTIYESLEGSIEELLYRIKRLKVAMGDDTPPTGPADDASLDAEEVLSDVIEEESDDGIVIEALARRLIHDLFSWREDPPLIHYSILDVYHDPLDAARALIRTTDINVAQIGEDTLEEIEEESRLEMIEKEVAVMLEETPCLACSGRVWMHIAPEIAVAKWARYWIDQPLPQPGLISVDSFPADIVNPRLVHPEYYGKCEETAYERFNTIAMKYHLMTFRVHSRPNPITFNIEKNNGCMEWSCPDMHHHCLWSASDYVTRCAAYNKRTRGLRSYWLE